MTRPKTTFTGHELSAKSGVEIVSLLKNKDVSATELIDICMDRMAQVEPARRPAKIAPKMPQNRLKLMRICGERYMVFRLVLRICPVSQASEAHGAPKASPIIFQINPIRL